MPNREKRFGLFLILVLIVLVSVLFVVLNAVNHKGEESKEALVKAYLTDLTNNDYRAILELTPSDYESSKTIQQKIKKYGGNKFKNIKINYLESVSTGIWFALISGISLDKNGKSYPYKDQLTLRAGQENPYAVVYDPQNKSLTDQKKQDRWFLLLGEQKLSGPKVSGPSLKIQPRQ